jgi:hypothetical protein
MPAADLSGHDPLDGPALFHQIEFRQIEFRQTAARLRARAGGGNRRRFQEERE